MAVADVQINLNELKAERIRKGISQKELANRLGVGSAWVYMRESGRREITLNELVRMAQVMGCTKEETKTLALNVLGD